jgi:hypothetical protein
MPNLNDIPRHRRGHHFEELDGEGVVYGRTRSKTFFMNDTASAVWKLCDGSRTVKDIAVVLEDVYPENKSEIAADVLQIVDRLVAEGLLAVAQSSNS